MNSSFEKRFDSPGSRAFFRSALEHAPVGILIFDNDFIIKYVNNNFFRFSGVAQTNAELIEGNSIFEYRVFENVDLRKELNELRDGVAFEREIIAARTLAGSKISIIIKCVPILRDNKFDGGIIILEDIKVSSAVTDYTLFYSAGFQNFLLSFCDSFYIADKDGVVKHSGQKSADETPILFDPDGGRTGKKGHKLSSILFKKHFESAIETGKTVWSEIPFLSGTTEQLISVTIIPVADQDSKIELLIVLVKKATGEERPVHFQDEEIKELRRYERIVSGMVDGLIGFNNEGKIIFWNESAARLLGLTRSEVYGKFIGKIFPQLQQAELQRIMKEIESLPFIDLHLRIGDDDSIAEHFSVRVARFMEDEMELYMMLCSNRTAERRRFIELAKSEEKFKNIIINSHEFICILDLNGRINYANPYFLEVFQYTEAEIARLTFTDLIDPYFLASQSFAIENLSTKENQLIELPLVNKLGQKIHVSASFSTAFDSTGKPLYYNVILSDITLKKESEKDLLLIRSLFEVSHDGIALISKKKFVLVNDSFVNMFGYKSASEIIGQDPIDFVAAEDISKVAGYISLAEEGKEAPSRFDFTARRRNNSTFEVENSVSIYETENEKFIVWSLRDVTIEKKASAALQLSEERYRSISENINESFWTAERVNGELKVVFYTPAIKKITGYPSEAFLNDPDLWKKIIHPDDVEKTMDGLKKLYDDTARLFDSFEYRIIDSLGNIIWVENKISLKRNAKGEIQNVFGVVSDITIAKRAEEELKKSARELKEVNEAKDRFISIISHDLRTPFSSILGFTDFLLNEKDLSEEKRMQYIQFIQESAKNMLSLVNSLLDYTRLQTGRIKFEPERINVKFVIDKSIQMLAGAALQKNIKLYSELDRDLYIHADENLLFQAFNNLISNAIKFTNPNGNIRISASADVEKRQVRFSVKDDGIGIKKEDQQKLFKVDSKFSTRGTAGERGSGLGLSLVADIVHKHGGEIWVESQPGDGSNFIFTIPVASSNILLVDDVKTDRLLYSKLIKSLIPNYSIIGAENGKEALDIIKQHSPALVITDHKMPVMSGYDLVKQLTISELKYRPPVIVLSSDINGTVESEYRELGIEFIFQKPVELSSFKNAIEQSLRKAVFT